jgi:hypothetical protein
MAQWLRRGSLSKRSTTTITTVSTDVIDIVNEYQHFPAPSSIGSSQTAGTSTKNKCNESYLSLGFKQTGGETAPCLMRLVQQTVTRQSYVTCQTTQTS